MTDRNAAEWGLSLLHEMMENVVCLHDDWNDVLGEEDWDQFDTNPMLLGARTCVMHRPIGFGERYFELLEQLDCIPRHVISPKRKSRSVSRDLLSDPKALSEFKEALSATPTLSTYYSYRNLGVEELTSLPSGRARCIPPIEDFNNLIERSTSYLLMQRAGVPVPVAELCSDVAAVLRFLDSANRSGFEAVVLKDHHRKIHRVASAGDLALVESSVSFPVLAERIYAVSESPVCQSIVYGGRRGHLFTINQAVSNFHYEGNTSPLRLEDSVHERIQEYNLRVAQSMPSYEGVFGIDYIVTHDGKIMAVDLNPRFNSSTYPYVFLERLGVDVARSYTKFRLVGNCPVPNLSYILNQEEFPALDKLGKSGVFVFNPVSDISGRFVTKWSAILVAESQKDFDFVEAAFAVCLERVRSASKADCSVGVGK